MITIAMKSKGAVDRNTLLSINKSTSQGTTPQSAQTNFPTATASPIQSRSPAASQPPIQSRSPAASQPSIQSRSPAASQPPVQTRSPIVAPLLCKPIPRLLHPVQKGQKSPLASSGTFNAVKACFGWNTTNPNCDIDVSAFLLGANGKVLGDDWFVFYGQPKSPDKSIFFQDNTSEDRQVINVDFQRLNPNIKKIVFVLTINEAFEKRLHFGMLKDAYIRILTQDRKTELISFQMTEYYSNVISMMIGELYEYNGVWKFNAVGNGVAKDLAGLCALYGVQVRD